MKHVIFILALSLAAPAMADAQEMKSVEIDYSTPTSDCGKIRTAGPATGVALCTVGIGLGSALIPIGMGGGSDPNSAWAQKSPGALAAGGTILGLSAAGLGVSIWRLVVKRKERSAQKDRCAPPVAFVPGIQF